MSAEKRNLGDLLSALCDGDSDPLVFAQLSEQLSDNPAAREDYLDYLLVHGILHWDHVGSPIGGRDVQAPAASARVAEQRSKSSSLPLVLGNFLPDGLSALSQARFSIWLLLAAALLSSGITAGAIGWRSRKITLDAAQLAAESHVTTVPDRGRGEFVATVVGAADARWIGIPQAVSDGARLPAGEVRLAEGLVEIVFDGGAKVLLQGPARFAPQSSRGGLLHSGKLVAHVPAGSPTFAVQTPLAVFVCEGAEFGIDNSTARATKLHVYSGSVGVSGRSQSSTHVLHSRVTIGEAFLIESAPDARLVRLAPQGDQFVRVLPDRRRRFPLGLTSYWNFDEQGGPAFDLQGENHGILQDVTRTAGLVGQHAIDFAGRAGQQINAGTGDGSLAFTSGITVEALFVSRWDGREGNYDEIYRKDDGAQRVMLALQNDRQGDQASPRPVDPQPVLAFGLNVDGRYSELELALDGEEGRPSCAEIANGRMHHVVATYDAASGVKAIYLDGTLRLSQNFSVGAQIKSGGSQPATIGNIFGGWETFAGVLDEVAIYARALTPREVAEHWENVQKGLSYFEVGSESRADTSI